MKRKNASKPTIVGMICQYSLNLLKVRDKGVLLEA